MEMMERVREEVLQKIFRIQLAREEDVAEMEARQHQQKMSMNRSDEDENQVKKPTIREEDKVGRNDPCPCGSGKKYKKCCGK